MPWCPLEAAQTIGIDLPLKALVWQEASGTTFLACNDPAWLAHRHALSGEAATAVSNMSAALNAVAKATT